MAAWWNGESGSRWAAHADRHDRQLATWGDAVLAAAGVGGADRVVDVGTGTGTLARQAARRAPEGEALGVDISRPLIERARALAEAEGPANVRFEVADAQVHPFAPAAADVAVSRFGVMFFDDLAAAFANIRRALAPGGRLAFSCWQPLERNDWAAIPRAAMAEHVGVPDAFGPGQPGPYSLAEPDVVRSVLGAAGFAGVALEGAEAAMWLGDDPADAYDYMRDQPMTRVLLAGKPPEAVEGALAALRSTLEGVAGPTGVELPCRGWVVSARVAG